MSFIGWSVRATRELHKLGFTLTIREYKSLFRYVLREDILVQEVVWKDRFTFPQVSLDNPSASCDSDDDATRPLEMSRVSRLLHCSLAERQKGPILCPLGFGAARLVGSAFGESQIEEETCDLSNDADALEFGGNTDSQFQFCVLRLPYSICSAARLVVGGR